jgi:hypothetical protein
MAATWRRLVSVGFDRVYMYEPSGGRERKVEGDRQRDWEGMRLEHISRLVSQLEGYLVVEHKVVRRTRDTVRKEKK